MPEALVIVVDVKDNLILKVNDFIFILYFFDGLLPLFDQLVLLVDLECLYRLRYALYQPHHTRTN